jgi:hypothetical protein
MILIVYPFINLIKVKIMIKSQNNISCQKSESTKSALFAENQKAHIGLATGRDSIQQILSKNFNPVMLLQILMMKVGFI